MKPNLEVKYMDESFKEKRKRKHIHNNLIIFSFGKSYKPELGPRVLERLHSLRGLEGDNPTLSLAL